MEGQKSSKPKKKTKTKKIGVMVTPTYAENSTQKQLTKKKQT